MQKMRSYALAIVLGLSLFGGVIGSGVINPAPTPAPMPPPTYPLQHTPPACGGPGEYACFPPTPTPCVSLCPKTLAYQVPSRPLACTGWQNMAGSGSNANTGEGLDGYYVEEWIQADYGCMHFQTVSRVQTASVFANPEPLYHWRVALYNSSNTYLDSYVWDTSQTTPSWTPSPNGWWYFYGPVDSLPCAAGFIHVTVDMYESTWAGSGIEEGDNVSVEGAQIHHNGPNVSVC